MGLGIGIAEAGGAALADEAFEAGAMGPDAVADLGSRSDQQPGRGIIANEALRPARRSGPGPCSA